MSSRIQLDDATIEIIASSVGDLDTLCRKAFALNPDLISLLYPHDSAVPCASQCIRDTVVTLLEVNFGLREFYAYWHWFTKAQDPPDLSSASFHCRYFADDSAARLYSAGEHLAAGIVNILELPTIGKGGKRSSRQITLGRYLLREQPAHVITKIVRSLSESKEWIRTIDYRNQWVHAQPPTIAKLGTTYRRGRRWKSAADGSVHRLDVGAGDPAENEISDLIGFLQPAYDAFCATCEQVVDYYLTELAKKGCEFDLGGKGMTVRIM